MSAKRNKLALFTLAGVFTAPRFLEAFEASLVDWLAGEGWDASTASIYPYGDWHRARIRQAAEVTVDVCRPLIGSRRAMAEIRREPLNEPVLLVGHSGGGIAGLHAANRLESEGKPVIAVVMIGSPKSPVPKALTEKTLWMSAVDEHGRGADRIASIGSWFWRPPSLTAYVPVIGGHADYFRSSESFTDTAGRTNLEKTMEVVQSWLPARLSVWGRQVSEDES